jgi:hypothetical protein
MSVAIKAEKKLDSELIHEVGLFKRADEPIKAAHIGCRRGLKEVLIMDVASARKYRVYPEVMLVEEKPREVVLKETEAIRVTLRRPIKVG